jgi:uncharacterized membrane protein
VKTRIFNIWNSFRSSYWFVPTIMAILAIVIAVVTTNIDAALPQEAARRLGWLYSGGAEGARSILSTVAGSMITIAGVVFSITIVVLSLTSTQFGPRLLSNFMRDTGTQVVLGIFIAAFVYCLFVLRVIRAAAAGSFIPHLSVTFAFIMALAGSAVLIYFIHHIAASIQADSIITSVYHDLEATIDRLFPEENEKREEEPDEKEIIEVLPDDFERLALQERSRRSGYLQAIDLDGLEKMAKKQDLILRLHFRPGQFVPEGAELISVWPPSNWTRELSGTLVSSFILGRQRTHEQDMEYALKQLVEIALRALSPGINDPFTAMTCIDWLCAAVGRVSLRKFPSSLRYDDDGKLRLVLVPLSFAEIVDAAFGQLRHAAAHHVQVILKLLDAVIAIAPNIRTEKQRAVLVNNATLVMRSGSGQVRVEDERRVIEERYRRALEVLGN